MSTSKDSISYVNPLGAPMSALDSLGPFFLLFLLFLLLITTAVAAGGGGMVR